MTSNRPLEEILQDPNANWDEIRNALKANSRGCTNVGVMKALSASDKNDDVAVDDGRSGRVVEKSFRGVKSGAASGSSHSSGSSSRNGYGGNINGVGALEDANGFIPNGRQPLHNNRSDEFNIGSGRARGPTSRPAVPPKIHEEVEEHDDCSGNETDTSTYLAPLSASTASSFDDIDGADVNDSLRGKRPSAARQLRNSPSVVSMCQSVNLMDFGVKENFHSYDSSTADEEDGDEEKEQAERGKKENEELQQHDDDRLRDILAKRRNNSHHQKQKEQEEQQLKLDGMESHQSCNNDATITMTTATTMTISTKRSDRGSSLRMSDKSSDTCYSMSSLGTNGFLGWKNDSDHDLDGEEEEFNGNPETERRIERSLERMGLNGLRRENEMMWEREMQNKMEEEKKQQDGLGRDSDAGANGVEKVCAATAGYKPSSGTSKAFYSVNDVGDDNIRNGSGSGGAPHVAGNSILNPLQHYFQRKSASSNELPHASGTNESYGASAFHRASSKEDSTSCSQECDNNYGTELRPTANKRLSVPMTGLLSAMPSREANGGSSSSSSIGRKLEQSNSGTNNSFWGRVIFSSLQGELDVPDNKHLKRDKRTQRHSQKGSPENRRQQCQLHQQHQQPQHHNQNQSDQSKFQMRHTPKFIPPQNPSPSNSEPKESVNVQDVKMALLMKVQKAPVERERTSQYYSRRASLDDSSRLRSRPKLDGTVDFDPRPDSVREEPEVKPVRTLPPFLGGRGSVPPKPFTTSASSNEDDNPFRRQSSTSQDDNHSHRQSSLQDDNPFRSNPKPVPALFRVADTKKGKGPRQRRVTLNEVVNPFLLLKNRYRNEDDDYSSESSDEESIELDCSSRHGHEWEPCRSLTASTLRASMAPNDNNHRDDDYYSSNINIRKGRDTFLDIEAERRKLYDTRSSTHTATTAASSSDAMWDEVDRDVPLSRADAMRRQGSRRWRKMADATGFIRRASLMAEHRPNIGLFGKTLEDEEESDEEDFASSAMW
ncbi:hypothetical protein ACHAXS_008394 [Conticribra weissflogii]